MPLRPAMINCAPESNRHRGGQTDDRRHRAHPHPHRLRRDTDASSVADLGELFGTQLANVAHGIADRGGEPAGAPYGRSTMDADGVDVEIGVPIAFPIGDLRPVADCEPGEMGSSELPGGEIAVTLHHGSYDGLSQTYAALQAWIVEQGRAIGGPPWESYIDDPFRGRGG